ncbi:MAG: methyl-accepting chemotaxis protein [Candidatus Omnitrophota bacterium]|nr:methyl-accepting chemotaxis protein [Candidatus Omnitrophota bacterium]
MFAGIRLKVILGFGGLVILMSGIALAALNAAARVDRVWKNTVDSAVAINNKAAELEYCRLMTRRFEKDFLLFYITDSLQAAKNSYIKGLLYPQLERMKSIQKDIDLLLLKAPQQEYFSTDKLPKLIDAYRAAVEAEVKNVESLEAGGQSYELILVSPQVQAVRAAAGALESESRKMVESASRNAGKALLYARNSAQNSLRLAFWLILCGSLSAVIFAIFMILAIGKSLRALALSAKEAVQGKLSESFKSALVKIRQAVSQLTLVSNSMRAVSSREISLTSEQSRAIRTAHDAAAKVLENITQISERLGKAADEANGAAHRLQEIRAQALAADGTFASINDLSHKIAKVSEAIAGEAEQINIIAMNASLEVARLAENQGSEFNPMMDSIRKLSDKAVKSTHDIAQLIESANKEAAQAAAVLLEAGRRLDAEISRAQAVVEQSQDISLRCAREGTGAKVVADAVGTLGNVVEMMASAAKEIEDSSTQLTRVSADLQTIVDKS